MYWWVRHDWVNYKVPIEDGRILTPHDYLQPGYQLDTSQLRYHFEVGKTDKRLIPDFAGWGSGAFFVNERGFDVFKEIFEKVARSYTVKCGSLIYYIVIVDILIDAFDDRDSQYERSYVEMEPKEDISSFKKIVLKDGFSTDCDIFRLDGSFALSCNIIASDLFKNLYELNGLTGLFFKSTARN